MTGPDSVTAIGDTAVFELRTTDGRVVTQLAQWTTPNYVMPIGGGRFVVTGVPTLARSDGTVTAKLNASSVSRSFIFSQQPVGLAVSDCSGGRAISFAALLAPFNATFDAKRVCPALVDRRGNPVPNTVTGLVRDERVARFVSADQRWLNAVSVGSTYAVYSRLGFTDSIRVDVRQDVASMGLAPAECTSYSGLRLNVNESVQLSLLPPALDAHGNPIDPSTVQIAFATMRWTVDSYLNASVTSAGLVTGKARSSGLAQGVLGLGDAQRVVVACRIAVI